MVQNGNGSRTAQSNATENTEAVAVSKTSEEDHYYSVVTDLSKSEVEAFAEKVKNCVTNQDWSGLAELVSDSVTVDGDTYSAE